MKSLKDVITLLLLIWIQELKSEAHANVPQSEDNILQSK